MAETKGRVLAVDDDLEDADLGGVRRRLPLATQPPARGPPDGARQSQDQGQTGVLAHLFSDIFVFGLHVVS